MKQLDRWNQAEMIMDPLMMLASVVNNASTLYLTVEDFLSTYVALMMPRVL